MKMILALAMCLLNSCLFAQTMLSKPRELAGLSGKKTITDGARALPLPQGARLLGVVDWDRDGRAELFAVSIRPHSESEYENHLLLLREKPLGRTQVEKEWIIWDTPVTYLEFFVPPDRRDTIKMAVNTLGGAYWSTV